MGGEALFRGADIPQSPLEEVLTVLRPIAARLDQEGILHLGEYDEVRRAIQTLAGLLDATPVPETLAATLELVAGEERTKVERLAALTAWADRLEEARPLPFVSDWSRTEYPPTQWIIPGWLPAGRLTMLVGPGAIGKTHIGVQVANAVAASWPQTFIAIDPAAGLQPKIDQALAGPPVVWASLETEIGDFQRRLWAATIGNLHVADGRVLYVNLRPEGALWGPPVGTHVSTAAEMLGTGTRLLRDTAAMSARLLVIDPLAAAYMSSENDRGLVRAFTTRLAEWAAQTGCAVLIIAHPPKGRNGSRGTAPALDDLYSGSTDWPASMQSLWVFSRCGCEANAEAGEDGEEDPEPCPYRQLSNAKLNEGPEGQPPLWFKWDKSLHTFALVQHTPRRKTRREKKPYGVGRNGRKNTPSQADSPSGGGQTFGGF